MNRLYLILLIVFFVFVSCSHRLLNRIDHDYSNIKILKDIPVNREEPNFLIFPLKCPSRPYTAIMLPFKLESIISHDKKYLSYELSKIVYSTFLQHMVFPKLILKENSNLSLHESFSLAKKEQCDLLILPTINYMLLGGSSGSTVIAIKIDIFDVSSQNLIYSITHSGEVQPLMDRDYIFLKTHYKIPYFVEALIIEKLTQDISHPLRLWNYRECQTYFKAIKITIKK